VSSRVLCCSAIDSYFNCQTAARESSLAVQEELVAGRANNLIMVVDDDRIS
jgi:hypothetical protein